jgi:putative redox protein
MKSIHISSNQSPLGQDVTIRQFHWVADEPIDLGGHDAGPSPFEWVLTGLGACKTMTVKMYAQRKQWPLEQVSADVSYEKVGDRPQIHVELTFTGDLSGQQRQRLLEIADRCPVHKLLTASVEIHSSLSASEQQSESDNDYQIVDCGFHDQLEALATLHQPSTITYHTDIGELTTVKGQIVDIYAANHADFLKLQDGTVIRLDRLVSVNDQSIRFAKD